MDFRTFHLYNRLVRRGLVKPLICPVCEMDYVVRTDADDEPVLQCFGCQSTTKPGLKLYSQVEAVVKEHFD